MRGLLILVVCILAGFPAVAASDDYSRDGWEGYVVADKKTGEFSNCTITKKDPNWATVDISLLRKKDSGPGRLYLFFTVADLAWKFEADRNYPWKMWVDSQLLATDEVKATKGYIVIVPTSYNAELLRRISRGNQLKISVSGKPVSIPLGGSARAIEWLEACATRAAPGAKRTPG